MYEKFYILAEVSLNYGNINWFDGAGGAVASALIGAFFVCLIFLITNDLSARKLCCHSLFMTEKLLRQFDYRNTTNRTEDEIHVLLLKIEEELQKVDIESAGLFFYPPNLKNLISDGLFLLKTIDRKEINPNYRPAYTASNLIGKIATPKDKGFKINLEKIHGIQKFLKSSFFYRLRHRFF